MRGLLLYILLLALTGSLFGQAAGNEVKPTLTETEQLNQAFQVKRLDALQEVAFQKRAEQKVLDWFEYMYALADTVYPTDMKDHLRQMASEMMRSPKSMVMGETVESFLIKVSDQSIVLPQLQSLRWDKPWTQDKKGLYRGTMIAEAADGQTFTIALSLELSVKQFGSESDFIWTILLDSIK